MGLLGKRPFMGGFLAVAAMSGYAFWPGDSSIPSEPVATVDDGEGVVSTDGKPDLAQNAESKNERIARMLLGTWETDRSNRHQEITFNEDGTATMNLKINSWLDRVGLGGAENVRLDVEWKITDGKLDSKTVGGEPSGAVKVINTIYGSEVKYKILKLTKDQLLIEDPEPDKEPNHDWKRIK